MLAPATIGQRRSNMWLACLALQLIAAVTGGHGFQGRSTQLCPAPCQCEEEDVLLLVDCSELGLSAVPDDLSPLTSYL
ncbi:leucine-rich repeat-containing G-protein coupled receptor 6 [Arapaima gigas]